LLVIALVVRPFRVVPYYTRLKLRVIYLSLRMEIQYFPLKIGGIRGGYDYYYHLS
jgi:hypothetical protein